MFIYSLLKIKIGLQISCSFCTLDCLNQLKDLISQIEWVPASFSFNYLVLFKFCNSMRHPEIFIVDAKKKRPKKKMKKKINMNKR